MVVWLIVLMIKQILRLKKQSFRLQFDTRCEKNKHTLPFLCNNQYLQT